MTEQNPLPPITKISVTGGAGEPNRPRKSLSVGKWTLIEELGQGGNGDVWIAQDSNSRKVALKFLKEKYLKNGGNKKKIERFRTEIEFLIRYKDHLGILPIIDYNIPAKPSVQLTDRPWFTTPLCTPLRDAERDNFSLERVVRDVTLLAQSLTRLHEEDITHRDIKPENLFWLGDMPVLGDFGLVDTPDKPALTEKSEIMGPLFYVAPEMMHDAADIPAKQSDVYSLAKTLWVLATRQTYPIPGEQRVSQLNLTLSSYLNHPRVRILDYLIDRATRHRPEERPSMGDFANELHLWLEPLTSSHIEPDLNWDAISKVLQQERAIYDEECLQRGKFTTITEDIQNDLRMRMERIMTDCSNRLRYSLGGGGLAQPLLPTLSNAKYIAEASVNLCTPYNHHGMLIGWAGVQLEEPNNLHILGAIAIRYEDRLDILWRIQSIASIGSATYDHEVEKIFMQLEPEFYQGVNEYAHRVQARN